LSRALPRHLKIDNTTLEPDVVARQIAAYFSLPTILRLTAICGGRQTDPSITGDVHTLTGDPSQQTIRIPDPLSRPPGEMINAREGEFNRPDSLHQNGPYCPIDAPRGQILFLARLSSRRDTRREARDVEQAGASTLQLSSMKDIVARNKI
jgi:hypothetical protein